MKSSLLKTIAAASLILSMQTFAQEDDQEYYNYGQDSSQADEPEDTEEEAPKATAKADVKTNAPANVQVNINVNVQNNNTNNNNIQNNSQSISKSSAESYASVNTSASKGHDMGVGARIAFDYGMMYGFEETDDNVDGDPTGIGFEGGLAARIEMVNNLYFVPEVNFSYLSTKHKYLELDRTYTSMSLEIPLLMRGIVAERFYVTAGPQLNLCLSSDFEQKYPDFEFGDMPDDFKENVEQAGFTFGIAAGAGVNIVDGLFFDFRFYMGLMELFPDVKSASDNILDADSMIDMAGAKMMTIKAGFSYWFM